MNLLHKVFIITGSSRGIGRAIAIKLAKHGAKVVITGKSEQEGRLPGTIYSVAEEIQQMGGIALPIAIDLRLDESIIELVEKTVATYGHIDGLINNAGAIVLSALENLSMKQIDLMLRLNLRAVLLCSHYCIPHLKNRGGAHILNLSPPLSFNPKWFESHHTAYTISKYGMTLATLGLAEELRSYKIAVNSLWPRTLIHSAATQMLLGEQGAAICRTPEIMADAAYEIVSSDPTELTGKTLLDESFLKTKGYSDFSKYQIDLEAELGLDLFVDE